MGASLGLAIFYGLLTFVSPCVLPLLPVFVTYFSQGNKTRWFGMFLKVFAFCIGITVLFFAIYIPLAFAATAFKSWMDTYIAQINAVCGIILVVLGLKFMGYLDLPFLNKSISYTPKRKAKKDADGNEIEGAEEEINLLNAFIMGLVFSVSMGTCAIGWGVTLIDTITNAGSLFEGVMIAIVYTLTVDILFIIVAMLLNQLKGVLKFIQRHQGIISKVCGGIMIFIGFFIALGFMSKLSLWFNGSSGTTQAIVFIKQTFSFISNRLIL